MTTYNTGNPLGSAAAKDLYDNAQNLDHLSVDRANETWPDRFGKMRLTWYGMEQRYKTAITNLGWNPVGTFQQGAQVNAAGDIIQDETDDVWYRWDDLATLPKNVPAGSTPDTTGGRGEGAWQAVDVSDVLRKELFLNSGAAQIGTASGKTVQQEFDETASEISAIGSRASTLEYDSYISSSDAMMRGAQLIRSYLKSSTNKLVTIIGDSISHGANAGGSLYLHSWVNIFKRCFNNEFQTYSYGYAPTTTITGWREIHEVAFLPSGSSWTGKEGENGGDIQQGLSFTSTVVGASQRVQVPTFQGRCLVHYVRRTDGAAATISVNGTVVQTVSTIGAYDVSQIFVVPMTDSKGLCTIEVTNTSGGALEIMGYSFISNAADEIKLMNYSISGRRLAYMSTVAMDAIFNDAAMVIMALGYNDSSFVNSDPTYAATFKTKIDYLISKSQAKGVPLVVPDFCWDSASDSEVRTQLKRLAEETSGLYIPFPDFFNIGREVTSNDFRVNTLKLFVDGAHPNQDGHKIIAETIAKAMQLSVTSKEQALRYHDWWYPLLLTSSGVANKTTSYDTISAARWQGKHVVLRFSLTGISGATSRSVQNSWPVKSGISNSQVNLVPLSYRTDAGINGLLNIGAAGAITAMPNASNAGNEHAGSSIII